jgi:hypothetical protein
MQPKPKWVWERAGFQTHRRPGADDVRQSAHPDVRRLQPWLPPDPNDWVGYYPQGRALVEREGEDAFVISFFYWEDFIDKFDEWRSKLERRS